LLKRFWFERKESFRQMAEKKCEAAADTGQISNWKALLKIL
jgi:hypothetical protein